MAQQGYTTYRLTFVDAESIRDPDSNGSEDPAVLARIERTGWLPGTSVVLKATAVPDNPDGTVDEFEAEARGRALLTARGISDEDYSLEEIEILERWSEEATEDE